MAVAGPTNSTSHLAKEVSPNMPNGHAGHVSSHASRSSRKKARPTYLGWTLNKAAKLAVWYGLITVFFRCPSSLHDITADTPQLCAPYLRTRSLVDPSVQPYYDQYLSPYVHTVQPYFNQIRDQVYEPASAAYHQYGAPRVAQAQKIGQEQWYKTVRPQLELAGKQASKQLDATVGPHVKKVQDVVRPYYDSVRTGVADIWELEVQPIYRHSAPYIEKFYSHGRTFFVLTALPQAQYASSAAWNFWIRQIWPHVRVLYGENVEPQLRRISQRLSRYRDRKQLQADIALQEAEVLTSNTSSQALTVATSIYSAIRNVDATSTVSTVDAAETPVIDSKTVVEQFEDDLRAWEAVCSTAVREGAQHLTQQITEISNDLHDGQIRGTGRALLTKLDNTAKGAINSVKASVLTIVAGLSDDADDAELDQAHQAVVSSVRAAGKSVKKAAQSIRDWRKNFNTELDELVLKAYESTLETVDNVRELRLSDVGRRYAEKGLPHKMWSKYNDLKKATKAWRDDIQTAALSHTDLVRVKAAAEDVESNGMGIAEDTATELGRLRDVGKWKVTAGDAEDDFTSKDLPASAERARKRVVMQASQVSESSFAEPVESAVKSAQSAVSGVSTALNQAASSASDVLYESPASKINSVVEQVSRAMAPSKQPAAESIVSQASQSISNAVSTASDIVLNSEKSSASSFSAKVSDEAIDAVSGVSSYIVHDTVSQASDAVVSGASQVSEAVLGTESRLSDTAVAAAQSVSAAVLGIHPGSSDTFTAAVSSASKSLSAISSHVSSALPGQDSLSSATDAVKSVGSAASAAASDVISSATDKAETVTTHVRSKIFVGAMAQLLVEAREPILDEDIMEETDDSYAHYSERMESIISQAGERASELTKAVADAFAGATPTKGTVESATSIASEQYERAISAASRVLLDSQATLATGGKAAGELYAAAVNAASQAISDSTSTVNALIAEANARLEQARNVAASQYSAAVSRVSAQISGTPLPVHEQMFASVESAYSAVLSGASSRFGVAASAIPTQNPFAASKGFYESISLAASSRLAEGIASASVQYQNAKIAVGAEPTPVHEAYLASAKQAYYQGIGAAHDQYSSFLEAASSAVGASPTTGYRAYLAVAEDQYSAAVAAASSTLQELVASASSLAGAKSTTPAESILSSLSSQYNVAYTAASSQFAAVSAKASVAVLGPQKGQVEKAADAVSEAYTDIASQVSAAIYGTETPWSEAMFQQAADNWNSLLSQASSRIYTTPSVPLTDAMLSSAGAYAAIATEAAASQYTALQSIFQELVNGKEPDFSESMMSRFQSAYQTGAPAFVSSASSYASAAYESASSVVYAVFTPPPQLESLLEQVNEQLESAVQAASSQLYGSSTGTLESLTSAAASVYSDAASRAMGAVDGSPSDYVKAAQITMAAVGASASNAISEALFGRPTDSIEAVRDSAASIYTSITSVAVEHAAAASAAVSRVLYGDEKGYAEKLETQLSAAIASAQSRIQELAAAASQVAADSASAATEAVVEAASSASSMASNVASAASSMVHEEL